MTRFAGYASVFHQPDGAGDVVLPGAFARSLARRGTAAVRMLWQHDRMQPIGIWEKAREDAHGLYVTGRLLTGVAAAREAAELISAGALDGLSIGFRALAAVKGAGGVRRHLTEIDLWEVSLVTFPEHPAARLTPLPAETAAR